MSKKIKITVEIQDEAGETIVSNVQERPVPYIEEIEKQGFRAAFHELETATLETRKVACELTVAEYLEIMSKKKPYLQGLQEN